MKLDLNEIDNDLGSPDENTRWQAAIALGQYCEDNPELIWSLVVKWGSSADDDVRSAISTCVLEHILEYHFEEYFHKTSEIVQSGNMYFRDTLGGCYKFGQAKLPHNSKRFDQLLDVTKNA